MYTNPLFYKLWRIDEEEVKKMLKVENIKKSFDQKEVVKNVSFLVDKGEAFGLLGPNGAGKSTLISMICGLVKYDQGDIWIDGLSVKKRPLEIKKKIGIVPQEIALYPTISARENLLFWGKMYGLTRAETKRKAEEVLSFVGLSERAKDKIETFSGGMKRRINIGAALMHEPELLIMDEPTVGIDPQSRNHILETIKDLNKSGVTIIYTSHYMAEVEYLCDRIGIIDQGEVKALGTQRDLCNRLANGTVIEMKLTNLNEEFLQYIKQIHGVERVMMKPDTHAIDICINETENPLPEIITLAVNANIKIETMERKEPNLESLFLQLTGRSLRD